MESLWALSSVLEGVSACFNDLLLEIALPPNTFRAVGGQVVIVCTSSGCLPFTRAWKQKLLLANSEQEKIL